MYKSISILIFLSSSKLLLSQDIEFQHNLELKSGTTKEMRVSYPVINREQENFAVFVMDYKSIYSYFFDKNLKLQKELAGTRPKYEYKNFLGHCISNNTYFLFYANSDQNELYVKSLDPDKGYHADRLVNLKFKKENFLTSISNKNIFYILTIKNSSSVLKIYKFEDGEHYSEKEIDFSEYIFSDKKQTKNLDKIMFDRDFFIATSNVQEIDYDKLYTLVEVCNKNKMYVYENKLYLTLDNDVSETKTIQINLNDFTYHLKNYKQESIKIEKGTHAVSNSYLYKNLLLQLKLSRYQISFAIRNITNDSMVKTYLGERDAVILFKNTELIKEGKISIFDYDTSYKDTKSFLKALESRSVGIHVYEASCSLMVTLGGYLGYEPSLFNNHHFHHMPPLNLPTPPQFPRTGWSVPKSDYTIVKSYFKSRFDMLSGVHIPGKLTKTSQEKIVEFRNFDKKDILAETAFKVDRNSIYGYYSKKDKKYYLRKFSDSEE